MDQELNDKTYESRLQYINGRYLAYVDIKPESSFVVLAIHQHLGLSNYFRVIVQALCGNQVSIVIPNLFGQIMDQSNRSEDDDESFLKRLDQSIIAQTLYDVFEQIKGRSKKIIMVGLSIGAAIGLKMLQFLDGIEFAMFFYGLPPANLINPQKIKSRTVIYVGERDRIKYLSDSKAVKQFKKRYSQNQFIEIYEVQDMHGFMNPASQSYNQQTFHKCCAHFQQLLRNVQKQIGQGGKKTKVKEKGDKGEKQKNDKANNANINSPQLNKPQHSNSQLNNSQQPSKQQQQNKQSSCHLI